MGELRRLDATRVSRWVFAADTVGGVSHMIDEIDECTLHARQIELECSVCPGEPGDDFCHGKSAQTRTSLWCPRTYDKGRCTKIMVATSIRGDLLDSVAYIPVRGSCMVRPDGSNNHSSSVFRKSARAPPPPGVRASPISSTLKPNTPASQRASTRTVASSAAATTPSVVFVRE